MLKYVIKRVGLAFVTIFLILSLTFILMKLLPPDKPVGSVAERYAFYNNQEHMGYMFSTDKKLDSNKFGEPVDIFEDVSSTGAITRTYFYSVSPLKQYRSWIKNIVTRWDWGLSSKVEKGVKATVIIGERLKTSIKLNILSVIFSVPIGILLGIWAALKKNTITDHIISTCIMIAISIPSFVLISFIMSLLCYKNPILPTQWPNPTDPTSKKVLAYIIPVFCLSFGSICGYCRYTRAELCEVMESEYLLLARTKGLTKRQAILRHALRNAMVPIVPSILAEFIGILGGSMILESLYGIPGIGSLFIQALGGAQPSAIDYSLLFVDMAIFTTISLLAGVVLDLSYGFIDPRIRMGAKK